MEEHVFTTNLILDKSQKKLPIWIVSLDLSKAFDRVIGQHHGEHFADKESHIIWFNFWEHFMQINGPSDGTIQ